jgi:CRISPR-associated protein Cmr2
MSEQYFHFTLGPVQGFVAQARRTRDFWAGSFILSWLVTVAMQATIAQGGVIQFPAPDENFMQCLEGKSTGDKPTQGSIPNRFKALIPAGVAFKPELVIQAVQTAWKALADKVWEQDLAHISSSTTKTIWDRQIPAFWDMSWVIVKTASDSSALDRRKNWRTYAASNEGGVKCTMMEGWQELSGAESPLKPSSTTLENFWSELRGIDKNGKPVLNPLDKRDEKHKQGLAFDIAANETLCSIAFVKRRFSRYFHLVKAEFAKKDDYKKDWTIKGWKLSSNVPSISYIATVHWLSQLIDQADPRLLRDLQEAALSIAGQDERSTIFPVLSQKTLGQKAIDFNKLLSCDGNVFFLNTLENDDLFPNANTKPTQRALKLAMASANLKEATPFCALLLMDGDLLGKQMSQVEKQPAITQSLDKFINGELAQQRKSVKTLVEEHNGFLVYAGGDDVLAILPLEDAITCATHLRNHYINCFAGSGVTSTISAAIEFIHMNTPLTQVLKDAHNLLDKVAKDEAGRDALAVRVWKRGGLQLEWAQPWEVALIENQDLTHIEQLTQKFVEINAHEDNQFSNKFLYKIREQFSLLNPLKKQHCQFVAEIDREFKDKKTMALHLLAVDYINSGKTKISQKKNAQERLNEAIDAVKPLLDQCISVKRIADKERKDWQYSTCFKADAALLIRFLAQKGVETR